MERLETRLYLSGLSSYTTASSDWFGVVDASFSSASGIGGSSTEDGTSSGAANVRRFLVRLTPEATEQAGSLAGVQNQISDNDVELVVTDGLGLPGQVIVSTTERDSVRVVQSLSDNNSVAYFEEDFSVGATTRFPNEDGTSAEFSRQYGLNNTGQTGGVADADIDAPEAWDISIGSTQIVASVIDSGVDFTHPDLYLNIWLNQGELPPQFVDPDATTTLSDVDSDGLITFRDLNDATNSTFVTDLNGNGYIDASDLLEDPKWADGIDTDNNGFEDDLVGWDFFENDNKPFDEHRHGTHVAGILGAVGDNGLGVSGVNWQTSIMPLRFLDEDNRGDISSAVEAINYTTMMRTRAENPVNVRVSNNSWGASGTFSQTLFDAVSGNERADILFVAAAGNGDVLGQGVNNDDVAFFPANFDLANVISVAAINDRGDLASFSNFGTTTVDIAAPGVGIVSTDPGGGFISRSGTSMATPFVAGTAALVFDVFPEATAAEVRDAILSGAVVSGSLDGFIAGSRSLNAFGALTASTFAPVPELVPVATITAEGTLSLDITVTYTDDGSVDTNSFDIRDVEVTRQGFSETLLTPASVATTTVNVDGQDRDAAVYTFTAPGGTFDATDNGTWFVSLREGEIQDNLGLHSAPRELGQFTVSVDAANVFFVNTTLDTIDADLDDGLPTDGGQTSDGQPRVSLRAAIMHANQAGAATTIVIPDGIYALTIPGQNENASTTGDLDLTSSQGITIVGGGAFATTIDAQQLDRVFDVAAGATAALTGLGIRNGKVEFDQGGGIRNRGTLTLAASLVTTNAADLAGGGVFTSGDLTVTGSSIEANQVTSRVFAIGGGGLATSGGQTQITQSSIVNNVSAAAGGGFLADDTEMTLIGVTIAANTAERNDGGGVLIRSSNDTILSTFTSVTITNNNAPNGSGGGLAAEAATGQILVSNSIVAGNTSRTSPDVSGKITSDGTSLFGQPDSTDSSWRALSPSVSDFDQIGTAQTPLDAGLRSLQRSTGVVQSRTPIPGGQSSNSDIAGTADLALTSGLPIVYSTVELEPNNSRGEAMRLDSRGWSLDANADITNAETIPHVTVTGTGDGTFDYFSFTVSQPNSSAVFDIDNSSISPVAIDSQLFLFDSNDTLLASNNDSPIDTGSPHGFDSRIDYTFAESGFYTLAVGTRLTTHAGDGLLTGGAPAVGKRYILNVSVENHELAESVYAPTSPANTDFPINGAGFGNGFWFLATEQTELFSVSGQFAAGDGPVDVFFFDVTGDGIGDIVAVNATSDDISILKGNGDATFQPPVQFATGENPQSVTVADVTGDGIDDIVTANVSAGSVSVLAGNGDGTFQAHQTFATGSGPKSVILKDLNGDGVDEIVTANSWSDDVSILLGNGDGTFQASQQFPVGESPAEVVVGDLNGDGFDDLVTANLYSDDVSVLVGKGDGTFGPATNFAVGDQPYSVALGDVDGDGIQDVATANKNSDSVTILLGDGDGTFQPAWNIAAGDEPISVTLNDVNGDGFDDIVTAEFRGIHVTVITSNGDGTFQPPERVRPDRNTTFRDHVIGDVNGDGVDDIIAASAGLDDVTVLVGRNPRLLSRTASGIESFPLKGRPDYFVETANELFWITSDATRMHFTLWSFSDEEGVRTRSSYTARNTDQQPLEMYESDGRILIQTKSGIREFDPVSSELRTIRAADGTFAPAQSFSVGDRPLGVVAGDLNGDGFTDLISADQRDNQVSVLQGNGDGTFLPSQQFPTGASPGSVTLGDINGDGFTDLVTGNRGNNTVSLLLGNGDGTFQPRQDITAGSSSGPRSVVIGDLNGDGFPDVVATTQNSDEMAILKGNGDGTFQTANIIAAGHFPTFAVLDDVNSDNIPDVLVTNFGDDDVSVFIGNGDATFQLPQSFATGGIRPKNLAIGDINGDGFTDLVTSTDSQYDVGVLIGNGNGTFQTAQRFASGGRPYSVALSDINGDGLDDIITANYFDDEVGVLAGNGDGTFESPVTLRAGDSPRSVILSDVNGDGIDDIITADRDSDTVTVLKGQSSAVNVVDVSGATVFANATAILVRQDGTSDFQRLPINEVQSAFGVLRERDYEIVQLDVFENKPLVVIRLRDTTSNAGETLFLQIDSPNFDPETGIAQPADAETLFLNSNISSGSSGSSEVLFVHGDRIFLTAEINGSGIGSELLVFDNQNGQLLVGDLLPGPESSKPQDFVADGEDVYFTALKSQIDNATQQPVLRRELFVVDIENNVLAVRAGQNVTIPPSIVEDTLFFGSEVTADSPAQLFAFDINSDGIDDIGAFQPIAGDISGVVFLDRNGNGQRDDNEPGRSGVSIFVDLNGNGRKENAEPTTTTRADDPATSVDESGEYRFSELATATYQIRELVNDGFTQTTPLAIQSEASVLSEVSLVTTIGIDANLSDPSVVGDDIVFVNLENDSLNRHKVGEDVISIVTPQTIVSASSPVQSLGAGHAQDGNNVVFTGTLQNGTEFVASVDSRGQVRLEANTETPLTLPATTLLDIEEDRNGGFDSLSIADGNVGFLADASSGVQRYFVGGAGRFGEFEHAQVLLDGDNEVFVDRVLDGDSVTLLSGNDLFEAKASLDARLGGNTGWQIITRTGIEILPLTFFDRIFDVSVSGSNAVFRAIDVSGNEGLYVASAESGVSLVVDLSTPIPDGAGTFTRFGSAAGGQLDSSVASDGENFVFVGAGDAPVGLDPSNVASGDVNRDGFQDLVVTNFTGNDVSLLLGTASGVFQSEVRFQVGAGPRDTEVADVTGDGELDIVTANESSSDVTVLAGNGDGTFAVAASFSVAQKPRAIAIADLFGDGLVDIVTPSFAINPTGDFNARSSVSVLTADGSGGFQSADFYDVSIFQSDVAIGDVNGDGRLDIATASGAGINLLLARSDGSFEPFVRSSTDGHSKSIVLADVDGDSLLDAIVANPDDNQVSVVTGNGDGTFVTPTLLDVGATPSAVAVEDVNGDSKLDIITSNSGSNDVSLLLGNGDGTFQAASHSVVGSSPQSIIVTDTNGDSVNDLVTPNSDDATVSILMGSGSGAFSPSVQQLGIYGRVNGVLRSIVDRNRDFGGKSLSDLAIGNQALSGNRIAFRATFMNGTEGIYLAELPAEPVASVTVVAGQTTSGVLFGASAEAGVIRGTSFTDLNVDGLFDAGESGNAGRTVFLDANLNGQLDDSEISTVTDSDGEFVFADLPAETTYVVREDLSGFPGLAVTVPQTLAAATVRLPAAGTVEVVLGSVDSGALGNSADGVVFGVIFNDTNGDGERGDASAEPGIPDLTVFVDENGDGILNGGERSSTTGSDGSYTIDQLRGTKQAVRVVLPGETTDQTSPLGNQFTKSTLRTVDSPVEVVTGDFNADGVDDIATTINQASEVRLFLNDGSGGFVAGESLEVSGGPGSIEVGRFLGPDGGDGLVVGHRTTSSVKVLTRQPGGAFNTLDLIAPQDVQAGGQFAGFGNAPFIVTTGDFNADGKDDIAVAAQNALPAGGAVAVFLSDGDGTFTHEQTLTLTKVDADFPTAITAGLVNAGGTVDLAITNLGTANVTILSNSGVAGSSRFSIDQHLPVLGRAPSSVQLGDLDGDGDNEIVTTNLLSNNVSVFDNNGDGTFGTATILSAGRGPAFAELIDLDQNGSLDIAFSNSDAGNRFGILRNRGDGTFLAAEASGLALLSDGTLAFSLAIGRFDDDNGDGVINDLDTPDVVVSNRSGESLNAGAGSLTVGLNAIVPGALSVELPSDTRAAGGLNFGLRTINVSPEIAAPADPAAIDEDAGQQTVVLTGITTGGETETLQVSVASDNTSLIVPTVTFDSEAGTATVRYTPAANQSGSARVTVTVRDAGIDGLFNAVDPDSDDGVATASFNVIVNPVNDLPPAEADTFGVLLENGATVLNVLANDNLANPDTGEALTILFTGQPAAGSVTIISGGQQLQYTPAAGFIGQENFSYIVSDNQFTAQGSVTVNVTSNVTPSDLLTVSSFTPNPSGFEVTFSEAFNASLLNLYATQSLGPADIVVTGSSAGVVNGSLITDAAVGSATFIKTGELLAPDTYTVTIRSANDSFVTADGDLLDGDSNGTGGDDFSTVFTVAPLSPETVTVSVPDFTRGFGQTVNVPADGVGIPLTISRGTGISALNLKLNYDSALLDVTGFVATAPGILADFNVATGSLALSKSTEFTADLGPLTVGYFSATVPDDAVYTSKHLVRISDLQVFDDSVETLTVPSVADSAIHVAAFAGDANASRSYNSPDTTLTLRQSTDRIDGLTLYPLADPALISDVTFDSAVLANDATVVQRLITSVDVPAVPDLPSGIDPLPARGDDPILSIPQNLIGRLGQTITVPVQLEVTEPSGITVSGLDVAISYDATLFSVSNVRVGSLLTDNDLSPFVASANTATPGQLLVTASSAVGTSLLAQNVTGDVFLIDFTVLPSASGGASTINLLANSGGLITGIADNDLSDLVLSPAPTNAANDSVDGLFTVTTDVTLVERSGDGRLTVRDASPAGLNNALTFTLDGAVLVITESVLPIVAAFGQQISDQEVRVALADLTTSVVNVQLLAGDDWADGSALTSSVSLRLEGGPGNDILKGGGGADVLLGGAGDDDLDGGGGVDVLAITQDGDLSITTTQTFGQGTDSFANIEQAVLEGGAGNNRLDASQATIPVTLRGQAGNDTLLGGGDVDVLDGGAGSDFAEIFGSNIVLTDGAAPGGGSDVPIALEGLQLVASARGSNIDASGYTLGPVTIIGSSGNDTLKGGSANDLIMAGAGRDSIDGGDGADFIAGGRGRDTINGNGGNDSIFGGGGQDLIDGGADADALFGGNRADTIRGGDGADFVFGGRGRDSIDGDDGADTLFGGNGRDDIAGGLGADRLNGIDRDDTFSQVIGRDTLFGGQRPQERPAHVSQGHEPVERQEIPLFQSPPGYTEEIDEAFGVSIMPELLEL